MLERRFFKENVIDKEGRKRIIEIIKSYLLCRDDVIFAYLHGSFAEGGKFRDIDLAIFMKNPVREIELESDFSYELSEKTGYPVEYRLNYILPWDTFDEESAKSALEAAQRCKSSSEDIVKHIRRWRVMARTQYSEIEISWLAAALFICRRISGSLM